MREPQILFSLCKLDDECLIPTIHRQRVCLDLLLVMRMR
jgi:hypothetical protein